MNIDHSRIAKVAVTRGDETLQFARANDKLALSMPADHPKLDDYKLEDVSRALELLTFDDVHPDATPPGDQIGKSVFTTSDGLTVTASVYRTACRRRSETGYRGSAGRRPGRARPVQRDRRREGEGRGRPAAGAAGGWTYQLGSWKQKALVPSTACRPDLGGDPPILFLIADVALKHHEVGRIAVSLCQNLRDGFTHLKDRQVQVRFLEFCLAENLRGFLIHLAAIIEPKLVDHIHRPRISSIVLPQQVFYSLVKGRAQQVIPRVGDCRHHAPRLPILPVCGVHRTHQSEGVQLLEIKVLGGAVSESEYLVQPQDFGLRVPGGVQTDGQRPPGRYEQQSPGNDPTNRGWFHQRKPALHELHDHKFHESKLHHGPAAWECPLTS